MVDDDSSLAMGATAPPSGQATDESIASGATEPGHRGAIAGTEDTVAPAGRRPRRLTPYPPGTRIGRFTVVEKLGAGGMGVVVAAYDPTLDRRVAIKLLHATTLQHDGGAVARFLREARAMAKVSHPNVLGVHEVGEVDDTVFIAMEFAGGGTLTAWLRREPRAWRSVVAMFIRAGRGLAAAHAAGLVHRDFKPDNALLTADGEVRVADFGLVRSVGSIPDRPPASSPDGPTTVTHAGAIMGTPAYMAPEQHAGEPADARADQFAFCVALYEALYQRAPFPGATYTAIAERVQQPPDAPPADTAVPSWIHTVVVRGLARRPDDRHPDMAALVAGLAADPDARRRRRLALAATAGGFVALASLAAYGLTRSSARAAPSCSIVGDRMREVWSDARKAKARAAVLGTKLAYAGEVWERVATTIDRYATGWIAARGDACAAHRDGQRSADLMDRQMACLDVGVDELDALVTLLESGDRGAIDKATVNAQALRPVAYCADTAAMLAAVAPPTDPAVAAQVAAVRKSLAAARMAQGAGHYQRAVDLTAPTVATAEHLGYPPLVAEAELELGSAYDALGTYADAERHLRAAYFAAIAAGDDRDAADAANQLIAVVGVHAGRADDAVAWTPHATATTRRLRDPRADAQLAMYVGDLDDARGQYQAAEASYREALAIGEKALGPDDPTVAKLVSDVAGVLITQARYDEAMPLLARALAVTERALGPHHPDVAAIANNIARLHIQAGRYREAVPLLERSIAIKESVLGADHVDLIPSLGNFANVLQSAGDYQGALDKARRALAIAEPALGKDHPTVALLYIVVGNSQYGMRDLHGAIASFEHALAIQLRGGDADHPDAASSYDNIGSAWNELGEPKKALDYHRKALAIKEHAFGADHPSVAISLLNVGVDQNVLGDHAAARAACERAAALMEKAAGPDQPDLAYPLTCAGDALRGLARPRDAIAPYQRALALREAGPTDATELARTRFGLARALWDSGGDRTRAASLAHAARDAMATTLGAHDAGVTEVDAWIAAHSP